MHRPTWHSSNALLGAGEALRYDTRPVRAPADARAVINVQELIVA